MQCGVTCTALFLLVLLPSAIRSFDGTRKEQPGRTTRLKWQNIIGIATIPARPLNDKIWFNDFVPAPFSCPAPPPPEGILKRRRIEKAPCTPKKMHWLKILHHEAMGEVSKLRRRIRGSQASRIK